MGQRRQPNHTPEPANQKLYQLPSKYPNIDLAKLVMGSFKQFGSMKLIKEQDPHALREHEKSTQGHDPVIAKSMLEATPFGKRGRFVWGKKCS